MNASVSPPQPAEQAPARMLAELIAQAEAQEDGQRALVDALAQWEVDEIALALEALPLERRLWAWRAIPTNQEKIDVLLAMHGEPRLLLIEQLPEAALLELFDELDAEELIELADILPDPVLDLALSRMDQNQRRLFEDAQAFPENSVGRWVNHDLLIVSQNIRVAEALRTLRREAAPYTEVLYLVDRTGRWAGCARITQLLAAQPHQYVAELKEEDYPAVNADDALVAAAEKVERSDYVALPVVTDKGVLLGRIHVGAAMEILRRNAEAQLFAGAGLDEEADLFAPVRRSARARALWLGINLCTAFLTANFIRLFEGTIQQVVALAVLMPMVASMGGIAGSQTLTLIVRGLALKQVNMANLSALFFKELGVGAVNGVLWALVIGGVSLIWFQSMMLSLVIACAIVVNILVAACSGVLIPVVLDRFKIDPALSGSVVLTTITDVVGFVAFLGLGTWLLL